MQDKFLTFSLMILTFNSYEVKSQNIQFGLYTCSLNKVDSFPDYYYLALFKDSSFCFYLTTGSYDHIVNERIAFGNFFIKEDTLILFDLLLKCDFKLLYGEKKLHTLKFFSPFEGASFSFFDSLSPNQWNDLKIDNIQFAKKALIGNNKYTNKDVIGCYINNFGPLIKREGKIYADYSYKINLKANGTFEYWIYNNLFLKGKWSLKSSEIQLWDSFIKSHFTLYLNEQKQLIPLVFPGNYSKENFFVLNKFHQNVDFPPIEAEVDTEIPDE
jgi:hypothetical protein